MPLRWMLALILVSAEWMRAEPTMTVIIPPAPERPATEGLARERQQEVFSKWRADYQAWESNLTAEQKTELKRRADDQKRKRDEEMERRQRLPLATDGYMWQQAAGQWKLDPNTVEHLGRDKIAYGRTVKQSFSPYFGGPIFITTDSLLNGFHVLFEDAFQEREVRQTTALRESLEAVFQQARKNLTESHLPPGDYGPGWRHAQFVVGPALCILGASLEQFDSDVREEIAAQVAKIRAAEIVALPDWLAPATPTLPSVDYRACKPVGFYFLDSALADYFRAVRWLQSIPFRMDREVELEAIGMLGYGLNRAEGMSVAEFFRSNREVLGSASERGLPEAAYEFQNFLPPRSDAPWPAVVQQKREWLIRDTAPRDLQTHRLTFPANAEALLANIEFRVLPACLLRDTVLFQHLADANTEPEGLAVAAMLGSQFARDHFRHLTPAQFEAAHALTLASTGRLKSVRNITLYEAYLHTLSALVSAPPDDGPAFLRGDAWAAKSCQTALAGWAQMRHTFTLQAHRSEIYLGDSIVPPGFVEPNPEFFSRLADLVERARTLLDGYRDRWDELASVTRKLEALAHKELRLQSWSPEDEKFLKTYGEKLGFIMGYYGNSYEVPNDDAPRWTEVHRNIPGDFSLVAAIGRPREFYVLYPWNGMEILCRGSVMPYYEYQSKERRTDAEWKQLLDSPGAPSQPDWLPHITAK